MSAKAPLTEVKSPFDIVNNIYTSKVDISNLDGFDKNYEPFLINRALSNNMDSVFYANELNKYSGMDKQAQYLFYFLALDKKARYGKWYKPEKDAIVDLLSERFDMSKRVIEEYISMMTKEQLDSVLAHVDLGGRAGKATGKSKGSK